MNESTKFSQCLFLILKSVQLHKQTKLTTIRIQIHISLTQRHNKMYQNSLGKNDVL